MDSECGSLASEGEPGRAVKYPSVSEEVLICEGERKSSSVTGVANTDSSPSVREATEVVSVSRLGTLEGGRGRCESGGERFSWS